MNCRSIFVFLSFVSPGKSKKIIVNCHSQLRSDVATTSFKLPNSLIAVEVIDLLIQQKSAIKNKLGFRQTIELLVTRLFNFIFYSITFVFNRCGQKPALSKPCFIPALEVLDLSAQCYQKESCALTARRGRFNESFDDSCLRNDSVNHWLTVIYDCVMKKGLTLANIMRYVMKCITILSLFSCGIFRGGVFLIMPG